MSVAGMFHDLRSLPGNQWGAVVSGLGVVFGVAEFVHIDAMSTPLGIALEAVLPLLGAGGLVVAGFLLWTERYVYNDVDVPRVVGWTVVGMVGLAVIFLWILAHQLIQDAQFHHAHFILINNLIAGSLIGFVIGTYDARSRSYQRSAHQERLKHEFLNRELRHHVLNGMQIILGGIESIEHRSDSPPPEAVATMRQRGEEIADRVENVRRIAQAFTEAEAVTLDQQDLSTALTETVERMDARYEGAVVSMDVPNGITVYADQFLSSVFENLLSNAIEHNDADPSRVRVSLTMDEESAVVRIADNGPGMPTEHRGSPLTWEERPGEETRTGIGLAIVNVLVDRYGGRFWVEDDDSSGAVATVELARVSS